MLRVIVKMLSVFDNIHLAKEIDLMIKYAVISTKFGFVGLGGSELGLALLTLPKSSREAVLYEIKEFAGDAVEGTSEFDDLPFRLQCYFNGEQVSFTNSLDFCGATGFYRDVWNATRSIPYGETRTYAWVAQQIGKPRASRAVGGALARNPFPIIVPCHRVVASNGKLGGFGGGLALKKRLLELEAARPDGIS
jgi:methylated-DNA-[protein]-cysteine S-methyltransferase